eukprot:2595107-Rhodomonas_salina.1
MIVTFAESSGLELVWLDVAFFVSQRHDEALALPLERLVQHGVKHGVEFLLDVCEQQRLAERHALFEIRAEVLVDKARLLAPVLGLLVLDPAETLALRIDHDRVARRRGCEDAVLDRQIIRGQTLQVPLACSSLIREHRRHRQVLCDGDALGIQIRDEVVADQQVSERLVERPRVRHEPARHRTVARQPRDLVGKVCRLLRPAVALARETVEQLARGVHLLLGGVSLVLEPLLLGHRRVELLLHRIELRLCRCELRLGARELLHGSPELGLLQAQRVHLGDHDLGDHV